MLNIQKEKKCNACGYTETTYETTCPKCKTGILEEEVSNVFAKDGTYSMKFTTRPATTKKPFNKEAYFAQKAERSLHTTKDPHLFNPRKIKALMDKKIVGQEEAKKTMSVAIYNHYKRINNPDLKLAKSNILMLGPTGCGKTYIAQTIAEMLDIPFAKMDATSITKTGWVGGGVEDVLLQLYNNAGGDKDKAKQGIIFIDEIDKLAAVESHHQDINGKGVQQDLLTIIDGTVVNIPFEKETLSSKPIHVTIDTTNILFICGGAFSGLTDIINSRNQTGTSVGYNRNITKEMIATLEDVSVEDLIAYGFMPEFLGRLPVFAVLDAMTENTLVDILTKPENSIIEQYKKSLALDGITLSINEEALREIAKRALARNTGARALKSIIEKTLNEYMYMLPGSDIKELTITKEYVISRNPR